MKFARTYAVLFLALVCSEVRPCTAFCLYHADQAVLARNLDWPVDEGMVLINRSGIRRGRSLYGDTVKWTSKYRSISFTQFGPGLPLGGMNEKGLVVEELNGPQFETGTVHSDFHLNELQLIQYLLDCCANVNEVKMTLDTLFLIPDLLALHYLLMDRMGNSLVIEPRRGGFDLIDPCDFGIPVLSNNSYQESLRYLHMHQGFGGENPVQHRQGSNERFVSVAHLLWEGSSGNQLWKNSVQRAFAILDTVSQEDTRWSIVYEPLKLCVYLKFHNCIETRKFSLAHLFDENHANFMALDMANCNAVETGDFYSLDSNNVTDLLQRVGKELAQILNRRGLQKLFLNWENLALSFISG